MELPKGYVRFASADRSKETVIISKKDYDRMVFISRKMAEALEVYGRLNNYGIIKNPAFTDKEINLQSILKKFKGWK